MSKSEAVIESELKGKTLLVYMHLLKVNKSTIGVREVQKALNLSSPSVAAYHLNKLLELGLVENERGDYKLVREVKIGVLRQFVTLRGLILPRFLFYAVLLTTMLATFILQYPASFTRFYLTTVVMGAIPTIILWYETVKVWREKPF
ncbi:hypothetical protein KEJ21_02170 [Candidatus Bathyarchaeota archaeon]|nr:hypothetical protein [Candidatus Bathyarchaeota archaeon]MBS7631079.1 hypothetical protein [Candidatus Bathyarchaeota archaeon]